MKKLKEGENLQNQIPEKPMLFQIKEKFEEKVWVRRSVELSGVILCLFLTFIPRTNQGSHYWPQLVHSLYLTYGKLAFVFGLSLIILPSIILNSDTKDHKNQKLLVRFLMDTKTFNFIAKVSFCTYLLHLAFILVYYGSTKSDFYYAFYPVLVLFVSFSVISIISGTVLVYMVEAPFTKLQK